MSKRPASLTIGIAGVLVLLVAIGAWVLRDRQSAPPPIVAKQDEPDPASRALPTAGAVGVASPPAPRPAPVASPPSAAKAAPAPSPHATPRLDEAALMAKLRALEGTDPPLTMQLAREGNARFPDSADAPERAWMVVKALANQQRLHEARDEAQVMVKRYPGTSWALDVQRHLLSNPLD